tara:strand:- start:780 stop:1457 length:678 start_codon:yes stop_codon:yes gene_type:complete
MLSISNVLNNLNNYWHYKNYRKYYDNGNSIWKESIQSFNNITMCDKLMIVAHPDDEIIFGGYDLITEKNWLVVFCTNDFKRQHMIDASSKYFKYNALLLSHADGMLNGIRFHYKLYNFLETIIKKKKWDTIVTHNSVGEYNHIQHVQVHKMVSNIVAGLDTPQNIRFFKDGPRLDTDIINKKDYAIKNFYERQNQLNGYKKLGMDVYKSEAKEATSYNMDEVLCK